MRGICAECGDTKPLTADGVCVWRHGCEHRQFVHEATITKLTAEMDQRDWHDTARIYHQAQIIDRWPGGWGAEWGRYEGTSPLFEATWKRHPTFRAFSDGSEAANRWIDKFLGISSEDDDDDDDEEDE